MAQFEVLALDKTNSRARAPSSGNSYVVPSGVSLDFNGSTSGTVTVKPAATAGAYSLTLPTSAGSAGQALSTDGTGVLGWSAFQIPLVSGANIKTINGNSLLGSGDLTISGGSGSPGGSTTQVQFNDAGAFGGDAGLAFDNATGKLTVGGKTVTASAPVLDLSQSWNAGAVTFTGIKFNITDTASAAGSLLMDLQVGGVSKFKVDKSGATTIAGNTTISGSLVSNGPNANFTDVGLGVSATYGFNTRSSGLNVVVGGYFSARFTTGSLGVKVLSINSFDPSINGVSLTNDGVNILAQRNDANGQTFRLYGNYLTGSDFRRLKMAMSLAGVAEIKPEDGGTYAGSTVLYISGLPTSNPGPGILWNNGGVVNVGT